jgi:hypothetical protein
VGEEGAAPADRRSSLGRSIVPVGLTKRRLIGAAAAVAVVLVAVVALLLLDDDRDPVVAAPPATTTTTVAPTTTTTIPGNHVDAVVATATVPSVLVVDDHPEGVDLTEGADADWVELPDPELARMPPIPRADFDSAGVRESPWGRVYDNPTFFGNDLTFLVLAEEGDWLEVLLHARPNGQTGWVHVDDVELSTHDAVIETSLGERTLRAWVDGEEVLETPVVVGTDRTPTPVGTFYLTEKIPRGSGGGAYGPWILSTNGYSEAMNLFSDGLPVIALHGTNAPRLLGSAASNGCIRLPNEAIELLAYAIPEGTPIQILP